MPGLKINEPMGRFMRRQQLGRQRQAIDFPHIQRILVLAMDRYRAGHGHIRPVRSAQRLHLVGGRGFHALAINSRVFQVQVL